MQKRKDEDKSKGNTMKFIKLLHSGYETQLNLPPEFCTMARNDFSKTAVVATCLGRWKVKVGNEGGIFYLYGEKWVSFVNQHQLDEGWVVMFEHHGSFMFHASIFDTSGCEFQPTLHLQLTTIDETSPFQCGANPTFTTTLTGGSSYNPHKKTTCCLYLPTEIWRSNNLQEKRKAIIRIAGLETKEWPAKLSFYCRAGCQDRMAVVGGWSKFVSDNNLEKGQKCTFQIIMDASEYGYSNDAVIVIVSK